MGERHLSSRVKIEWTEAAKSIELVPVSAGSTIQSSRILEQGPPYPRGAMASLVRGGLLNTLVPNYSFHEFVWCLRQENHRKSVAILSLPDLVREYVLHFRVLLTTNLIMTWTVLNQMLNPDKIPTS